MDAHVLSVVDAEQLRRVAAADGDRDVPVCILVEDDVAGARVRERPGGDRVVLLGPDLELEAHARHHTRLLELSSIEVELHVAEAIDREYARVDSSRADLRTRNVDACEGVRRDR